MERFLAAEKTFRAMETDLPRRVEESRSALKAVLIDGLHKEPKGRKDIEKQRSRINKSFQRLEKDLRQAAEKMENGAAARGNNDLWGSYENFFKFLFAADKYYQGPGKTAADPGPVA